MRKSAVAMPLLALIAGAFGFLFRQMEINTAFESVTGFAKKNAPSTMMLLGLTALVIVLAAVFAIIAFRKFKAENDYSKAFEPKGFLYIGASFLLGFAWLAADVIYFLDRSATAVTVIDIIFVFLAALAAFSVIFMARGAYKGRGGTEMFLFSVVPPIFFCFWLIILYKDNAANPVLLSYGFQCIAIATAALSYYFSAGFVYKKSVTGRSLFSFLVTIYFCTVVLADNVILPIKIFFAVTMLVQFCNTILFIRNLKPKDEI